MQGTSRFVFDAGNVTPHGPMVLVERCNVEEKTAGKIQMPETSLNKSLYCKVMKVGDGEYIGDTLVKCSVKEGDTVVVRQMDGKRFSVTRQLLMVHQDLIEAKASHDPWKVQN